MGYKEVKPKRWMKPIGYQLLSYNEDTNDLSNWFKDIKGEIVLWERTSLLSAFEARGDYLQQLKMFECYTRTDIDVASNFELNAVDIPGL